MDLTSFVLVTALAAGAPAPSPTPSPDAPRKDLDEVLALRDEDKAVIVDVRSAEAYGKGHIPGALSIPFPEVAGEALRLRRTGKTVVLYCA